MLKKVAYKSEPKMQGGYCVLAISGKRTGYRYFSSLKESNEWARSHKPGTIVEIYRQTNNFIQAYEVKK